MTAFWTFWFVNLFYLGSAFALLAASAWISVSQQIPNFGAPGRGPLLAEGMTFAIEPMITAGGPDVLVHDDEWSISSRDGSLAEDDLVDTPWVDPNA